MAASEPRRGWTFSESQFSFPHRFLRGLQVRIGSDPLYLNPELIRLLSKTRPEILLVAGAWIHPSVWITCMFPFAQRTVFWSESHQASIRKAGAVRTARRLVLSRFREFAVPGTLAKEYVERHAKFPRVYLLPNLVDPSNFRDEVNGTRCARPKKGNHKRVLLISARLAAEKGLLQFLNGLRFLNQDANRSLRLHIAGSGPLQAELHRWISDHDLDVRLLGYQSETEMVRLYAEADGFCLPSIADPNPVSVIEALWAGLPLLLSSRVGNYVECLREGDNGFLFDPRDPGSVASAVSRWLTLSASDLGMFGRNSLEIAQSQFDPDEVTHKFLDQVLADSFDHQEKVLDSAEMTS